MNQNKLTFESEKLQVDWIGFNIHGLLEKIQLKRIAKYLYKNFGFNSTIAVGLDGKQEPLFHELKNKYQVSFRIYTYDEIYWDGIKIDFSGRNAQQFYRIIGANLVNWKILNQEKNFSLSRLDLCYPHNRTNDNTKFELFLNQCYQKIGKNKTIKNFSIQHDSNSWILKIGKRGSPNYFRIYQNHTQTRFELEQRGAKLKPVQELMFRDDLEEFERVMIEKFFKYTKKVLTIDDNYFDVKFDLRRKYRICAG